MILSRFRLATIVFFCAFIVLPLSLIKFILITAFAIACIEVCKFSGFAFIAQVLICIATSASIWILILLGLSETLIASTFLGVAAVALAISWSSYESSQTFKVILNVFSIIFMLNILCLLVLNPRFSGLLEIKLLIILIAVQDFIASKLGPYSRSSTELFRLISPNKTYFGFLGGGAISSCLVIFASEYFDVNSRILISSLFLAMIGDLFYSCVKRANRIKDFGNLLGKKGGMTDRVDSMVISLPICLIAL